MVENETIENNKAPILEDKPETKPNEKQPTFEEKEKILLEEKEKQIQLIQEKNRIL